MNPAQLALYPSLRDRIVVVTGGASGIGEAIVASFVRQGSQVVFFDIDEQAASRLIERMASEGYRAPEFMACDLTDTAALQLAMQRVIDRCGTIDVLINNAGDDTRHGVAELTPQNWDRIMALNLKHQFFATQSVLPSMQRVRRGSIINMSSIGWVIPSTGMPAYVTAKAAIVGLTRTLAHEVGPYNIRVNAVMPGAILTERQKKLWFTPEYEAEVLRGQALKRMILPGEVASVVLFLAADDSAGITNQSYVVDGGWV